MIICLAGLKGSGKDTIADILVKDWGYTKRAIADDLKEMLADVFNLDKKYFYDVTLKEKEFPNKVEMDFEHIDKIRKYVENLGYELDVEQIAELEEFVGISFPTPRNMMQIVGTDIVRSIVDDSFWIRLTMEKLKERTTPVVICDVRLSNEREAFQEAGTLLILIKRPDLDQTDTHISENDLGEDDEYDVIITNNGSKDSLRGDINMWYSGFYRTIKHRV